QKLQAALEAKEEALAKLDTREEAYRAEEDAAVAEAMRTAPTQSAYKLGAPAQVARQKREELARTRQGLEKERLAPSGQIQVLASQEAAQELQKAARLLNALEREQREKFTAASELYGALAQNWADIAAIEAKRCEIQGDVHARRLLEQVRVLDPVAADAYQ